MVAGVLMGLLPESAAEQGRGGLPACLDPCSNAGCYSLLCCQPRTLLAAIACNAGSLWQCWLLQPATLPA